MIQSVNISPLPFYQSLEDQAAKKPSYRANLQALVIDRFRLPTFQVVIGRYKYINSVAIASLETNQVIDITGIMLSMGLTIKISKGFNLLVFPSIGRFPRSFPEGLYYLSVIVSNSKSEVPLDKEMWFSEVFCINNSLPEIVELTYGNTHDLTFSNGVVDFESGFKFRVLLPTSLGQPKYPYIEEGKSRGGYTFIEQIISSKTYQFSFLAPEYLVDALRIFKLCDRRIVRYKGKEYRPLTSNMDVEWQTEDIALVTMEIGIDNIVASLGQGIAIDSETNTVSENAMG